MAVTFRGDRPPLTNHEIEQVRRVAHGKGLSVRVYSQVERDVEPMKQLAIALGSEFVDIPSRADHSEQEPLVRALHRDAAVVLSDRLHALVMGATEGAIPMVIHSARSAKARTHFRAAGVQVASLTEPDLSRDWHTVLPEELIHARRTIRAKIDAVAEGLGQ